MVISDSEEQEALQEMERRGGHFASRLAAAWRYADEGNRLILRESFGWLLKNYLQAKPAR